MWNYTYEYCGVGVLYCIVLYCTLDVSIILGGSALQEGGILSIRFIEHRTLKAFWKVEVWFHAFITSTLKVGRQLHTVAFCPWGMNPPAPIA